MDAHTALKRATKNWFQWLIRGWRVRAQVRHLMWENEMFRAELDKLKNSHTLSRSANKALVRFIHARHKSTLPFPVKLESMLED